MHRTARKARKASKLPRPCRLSRVHSSARKALSGPVPQRTGTRAEANQNEGGYGASSGVCRTSDREACLDPAQQVIAHVAVDTKALLTTSLIGGGIERTPVFDFNS